MVQEEYYMKRCLELAVLGKQSTSPNPMVGAVIVQDNQIIGEGYHENYGGPHAEVNAIQEVFQKYPNASERLSKSTLYISLEPCSFQGKTPACSLLIIEHKIPKVVVACLDPNERVNGQGVALLKKAGVDVKIGVLEKEAQHLNRRFFTKTQKNRPYILLKWAETADGYFAPEGGAKVDKWPHCQATFPPMAQPRRCHSCWEKHRVNR